MCKKIAEEMCEISVFGQTCDCCTSSIVHPMICRIDQSVEEYLTEYSLNEDKRSFGLLSTR